MRPAQSPGLRPASGGVLGLARSAATAAAATHLPDPGVRVGSLPFWAFGVPLPPWQAHETVVRVENPN